MQASEPASGSEAFGRLPLAAGPEVACPVWDAVLAASRLEAARWALAFCDARSADFARAERPGDSAVQVGVSAAQPMEY